MIVSIHQPQYIGYLGYFDKISKSDIHVFLDDVEYSKGHVFNRQKIRTKDGWQWLTIPIKYKNKTPIKDIEVADEKWKRKHLAAIETNYSKSRYFGNFFTKIKNFYIRYWFGWLNMVMGMNKLIIHLFGKYPVFLKSSDLNISGTKNERLINICKKVGADVYLSGDGAREYMDDKLFEKNGIEVTYQNFKHPVYKQLEFNEFIPNMSALDYLFNCGNKL